MKPHRNHFTGVRLPLTASFMAAAFLALLNLSAAENLIKNGQFTEPLQNGKIPNWKIYPEPFHTNAEIALDTTQSVSGGVSLRITNNAETLYSRVDQLHIPCKPGTRYIARFYARGKDVSTHTKGGARMFVGPHGTLQYPIVQAGPGIAIYQKEVPNPWSYDWTLYESAVFSSGDSKELGVTLYLNGASGTVWFDNVEIFEYTPDLELERRSARDRQLMREDINTVKALAPELSGELQKADDALNNFKHTEHDVHTGMPFFEPQKQLGELFSTVLAKKFPNRNVVISAVSDPLAQQSAYVLPDKEFSGSIRVTGLNNEPESFALNVTNVTDVPQSVTVKLPEGFPMNVRLAVHVETDRTRIVDDALVLLRPDASGSRTLTVPAGMTRQLYFTATLDQARTGTLVIGEKSFELNLAPIAEKLPDEIPMSLFSYAYLVQPGYVEKRYEATQKSMQIMHDNVVHPYQFDAPLPVFDENGKFQPDKMDWSRFDKQRAMKAAPRNVIIYLPVHSQPHISIVLGKDHGKELEMFSPEWERRLTLWVKELVRGLAKRGVRYDKFMLLFCDEPGPAQVDFIVKCAKLIRKIDPKLRFYNNFHSSLPKAHVLRLIEAVDVPAPEVQCLTPETLQMLRESGKEIWCYHVQNRTIPGAEMRDRFKLFKRENFRGFSYWCFRDTSPDWAPTGQQSYSVVYSGDAEEWIPSKRSEGIKEGMEDYALLTLIEKVNPALYKELVKDGLPRAEWRRIALIAIANGGRYTWED